MKINFYHIIFFVSAISCSTTENYNGGVLKRIHVHVTDDRNSPPYDIEWNYSYDNNGRLNEIYFIDPVFQSSWEVTIDYVSDSTIFVEYVNKYWDEYGWNEIYLKDEKVDSTITYWGKPTLGYTYRYSKYSYSEGLITKFTESYQEWNDEFISADSLYFLIEDDKIVATGNNKNDPNRFFYYDDMVNPLENSIIRMGPVSGPAIPMKQKNNSFIPDNTVYEYFSNGLPKKLKYGKYTYTYSY